MLNNPQIMEIAIRRVRSYIRDTKELNKLLGGKYESDNTQIKQALMDALWDWNISNPPLESVTLQRHPAPHLLIRKASLDLLKSAGIWHSREHLPSSDGGTSADDHAKIGEYSQWISVMEADYEKKKTDLKEQINIKNCYGGVGSEYDYDSGWGIFNSDIPTSQLTSTAQVGINDSGLPNSGSAPATSDKEAIIPFSFTDPLVRPLIEIPAGSIIYEIRILVSVDFDGVTPTITIGDSIIPDLFVNVTQSDLKTIGSYLTDINFPTTTPTMIYSYIISSGSNQGNGSIIISYG